MSEALLEVRNLKKYFKTPRGMLHAVDDISFTLDEGKTLGVVGESGCGKTTLGRTVLHLIEPTSGEIIYNGKDISTPGKKDLKYLCTQMQIIFQDPYASLNPRMTIGEAIADPLIIQGLYSDRAVRTAYVQALMEECGLDPAMAHRYPHEFSGGQRQRIGIARSLIMEPEFIIADEPISALDVSIRAQVLNLMSRLQKERGLTYLFIAHDLSVMRFICDRIAVIHKGVIVELSETEKLFAHPLHPYTRALLSAIPMPDPESEKKKVLEVYDPSQHHYETDKPVWTEIEPGHFIMANQEELAKYKAQIAK